MASTLGRQPDDRASAGVIITHPNRDKPVVQATRATVIVLGDARTNGRDPRADIFAQIATRAGRTFWLNPEPRLYWNYGDSVISSYAKYCTAFECWRTDQLEEFVKALTRPMTAR